MEAASGRVARAAVVGLGVVLLALAGFSLWASALSRSAGDNVRHTVTISEAFDNARFAASQLESLNRKYRLEPSALILGRWRADSVVLTGALARVRALEEPTDSPAIPAIMRQLVAYRRASVEMFAAVRARRLRLVLALDHTQVDPRIDAVLAALTKAAGIQRREADEALASLGATEHLVAVAAPAAFGLGLLLLVLFGSILRSYRRRIVAASHRELEHLQRAALTDGLTELRNRRAFREDLARETQRVNRGGGDLSLVLFDVDRLKDTNDRKGHQAGDEMLCTFATTVREATRGTDLVYRIGGDEFATILVGERAFGALEYARRVQAVLRRGGAVSVTAGVAEAGEPADGQRLFRQADLALIDAKRSRRPVVAYSSASEISSADADSDQRRHYRAVLATSLARAVDVKDSYTRSHCETVAELCTRIAERLSIEPERLERIRVAGLLHDVGKIGIADAILQKPGALDEREFATMRTHSVLGERILAGAELFDEAVWVRHHHERIDGTGYPDGLAGTDIPLESRIILVADAFEAMTADRPYRAGRTSAEALAELQRHSGTQFDSDCVAALVAALGPQRDDEPSRRRQEGELEPVASALP